jgi:hypothetical protein
MTAFLRRATSGFLMWLGLDSATVRGLGLGRPGSEWLTWSLRGSLVPVPARVSRPAPRLFARVARVCGR